MEPTKESIRTEKLAALREQSEDERAQKSAVMVQYLLDSEMWQTGVARLLYHPLRSEPDINRLIEPGTLLPRVTENGLEILRFQGTGSLRRSKFGMFEPDPAACPSVAIEEIGLALVPGVGFDPETGARLGRGGGYYDRLLSAPEFTATTIGVAFELQMVGGIPIEPHDQRVDFVLTESGIKPIRGA